MANNFSIQVKRSHYWNSGYNHKARWIHYWQQIQLIISKGVKTALEIGPGAGVVAGFLKSAGVKIITVDIDPELNPDIVASVLNMPFKDDEFDLVMAAEVLEHLPFKDFKKALLEIKRVTKKDVVISLPDHRRTLISLFLKIPFVKSKLFSIRIPSFKNHYFDGQHYWEIGKKGFPLSIVRNEIKKTGLKIIKDFAPWDIPLNHYFILEKN